MILDTTKNRILQYLDFKKIKIAKFYDILGIKRGLLDSDKLKSTVSDVVIAKIIVKFPDINPIWLLTGNGQMLRDDNGLIVQESVCKDRQPENDGIVAFLKSELKEKDEEIARLNKYIGALESTNQKGAVEGAKDAVKKVGFG
ncbi:MAG: hypothetical protein LBR65_03775 [Culturomica sp.]|jgi:hypothetical protein|nr:hypothetical protein [Culturomica sp.]